MAEQLQDTVEIEDTAQGLSHTGDSAGTAEQQDSQPQLQSAQTARMPQKPPVIGCTGDCRRCHEIQRGYCASQIAYNMQNAVARVEGTMATMAQAIAALTAKVESLQAQLEAQRKQPAEEPTLFTPEPPAKPSKKK